MSYFPSLPSNRSFWFLPLFVLVWLPKFVFPADTVVISRAATQVTLQGEIVVEAQDGGMMFRANDGRIWMIQPDEVQSKRSDDRPFSGIDANAFGKQLIATLPASAGKFRVLKSKDIVIAYNTSPAFANWVKGVYLRLTVAFANFWDNKGMKLSKPDVPLGVIIFKTKQEFDSYSIQTLGSAQGSALAYYNMQTNQVVMYDLTGLGQFGGRRVSSTSQLTKILRQPAAEAMVATIVHEAVHQISFNTGLQNRFGPYPFWLNEGLAMFFEVPDLKSRSGWHGIGKMNHVRLEQIKQMVRGDATRFFDDVLASDERFRDPEQILNSYAESWALNFYLIHRKPKEYIGYLQDINKQVPLTEISKEERLELFTKHFGSLDEVKSECFRYILR